MRGVPQSTIVFFWKGSIVLQGYIGVVEDDQFWDVWAICLWFKWFGFDLILCSNEVWILDRILRIFSSNDAPFSLLAMSTFKVDVPQWQSEVGPVLLFLPVALVGGTWWGYVWL